MAGWVGGGGMSERDSDDAPRKNRPRRAARRSQGQRPFRALAPTPGQVDRGPRRLHRPRFRPPDGAGLRHPGSIARGPHDAHDKGEGRSVSGQHRAEPRLRDACCRQIRHEGRSAAPGALREGRGPVREGSQRPAAEAGRTRLPHLPAADRGPGRDDATPRCVGRDAPAPLRPEAPRVRLPLVAALRPDKGQALGEARRRVQPDGTGFLRDADREAAARRRRMASTSTEEEKESDNPTRKPEAGPATRRGELRRPRGRGESRTLG